MTALAEYELTYRDSGNMMQKQFQYTHIIFYENTYVFAACAQI